MGGVDKGLKKMMVGDEVRSVNSRVKGRWCSEKVDLEERQSGWVACRE